MPSRFAGAVMVLVRRNANLSTGGTAIDVTERVHPAVAASRVDAAKIVGLDIAGIDVWHKHFASAGEQDGIIVEVNAAPGCGCIGAVGRDFATGRPKRLQTFCSRGARPAAFRSSR